MRKGHRVLLVAAALAAGAAPPVEPARSADAARASVSRVLVERFGFTPAQVAAVERGQVVAVALPSSVDREVAVAGAVRIAAPPERLVEVVRDVERLESGKGFLHTRKISVPPALDDFAALELPPDDIKALRTCQPGRCDVKLGQGAFDQLARIDWRAPGAASAVNAMARQMSLDYVRAYQQGGNDALAVYRDTDRPQFIAREFDDMVQRTSLLPDTQPALVRYLAEYPRRAYGNDGVEEFFYWSMADFGLKPVLRINHVVVHPGPEGGLTRYAIATKQLYASHYFHTALELRAALTDPERPGSQYLLTLNVARSDGLTGLFGGLVKSKVRSGSRQGLEKALEATRRLCEARRP